MPEDYALNLEEMKRMMANARGTNLAGQSITTDPTYSSGFDYARSIAGGMPLEDVVAPGYELILLTRLVVIHRQIKE